MNVDAAVYVDGKLTGPQLLCTKCGALIARGLADIHSAWHKRHDTPTVTP